MTGARGAPVELIFVIGAACDVDLVGKHTDEITKTVSIVPTAVADLLAMPVMLA